MALEEYLLPEEKVLATVGTYHATNKRVIRYRKKFLGEEGEFIIKKANSEEAKKFAAIVREHIYR